MKKLLYTMLIVALAVGLAVPMATQVAATDGSPTLYGVECSTGWIYQVDPLTSAATQVFKVQSPVPIDGSRPNGVAFDGPNNRVYYATYKTPNDLYFYDGSTQVYAGPLGYGGVAHEVAAADFYDGKYYYIAGGPAGRTDDLYEVAFNADGTIASVTAYPDITGADNHKWWFYGDLAISPDGTIYANGLCETHGNVEFFKVDRDGTDFSLIGSLGGTANTLQLGFGCDGTLYGHNINQKKFYSVDTGTGALTWLSTGTRIYTDLASDWCATQEPPETICACEAVEWDQGVQLNGAPVQAIRSDPANALGGPDATETPTWLNFFSLGFGSDDPPTDPGWIVVKFCAPVCGSLTVYECTPTIDYGYPMETADVSVSQNGIDWVYVGEARNNTSNTSVSHPSTFDIGSTWIQYVKIVDTTDKQPFIDRGNMGTADAFDVDAVCGEVCLVAEEPGIAVDKEADVEDAQEGDTINYAYLVTNPGSVPLSNVTVSDNLVSLVTYQGGDDGDGILQTNETWVYTGSYLVPWFTAGPVENTGNATGVYDGTEVWDTDDESVPILHNPGIDLTKEGPAPVGYFQSVDAVYHYSANNTGDCSLDVTLVDDTCAPEYVSGDDNNNGLLDPGETWDYKAECTLECEGITSTVFTNTATATGVDATGQEVSDTACWNVVVFQWLPRTIGYWGNWDNHWSATCMTQFVAAVNGNSTYFDELTVADVNTILLAANQAGKMDISKATTLLEKQLLATWLSVVSYMGATDGDATTCGSLDAAMDPNAAVYFETGGSMTVQALLDRIEYNLTTGADSFGIDGRLMAKDILDDMNNAESNDNCYDMFMAQDFDADECPTGELPCLLVGDWSLEYWFSDDGFAAGHCMSIAEHNLDGSFSGTGYSVTGPSWTWDVTGTLTDGGVSMTIIYDQVVAGTYPYIVELEGTVSDCESMSGTAYDNMVGSPHSFDWTATRQ